MEITEVKVFPVREDKLKAFVSIVFDGCFMVNDVKVIQGKDGLFISMPSRRKKNGEFKDVAHPLNTECRRMLESRILAEYDRLRDRNGAAWTAASEAHGSGGEPVALPAGRGDSGGSSGAVAADRRPATLDEVEDFHLRDSFWSLS